VKWRPIWVTSGHARSRDVISCHVTATSCELQPCRSSNVPKTRLIGLLQLLPGDFRSYDVHSGSLPVTWRHFLSRDYHLLRVTALRNSNVPKSRLTGLLQPLPVTSGPMTSLPGHFRSCEVRDVISFHLTATFRKLQSCRSSNIPKSRHIDLLQPLPGDFRSNDVTSNTYGHVRSSDVISCHITAPPASYSPVVAQKSTYRPSTATSRWLPVKWRPFRVTSGHVRSRDVISCHVTATSCELQPVGAQTYPKLDL